MGEKNLPTSMDIRAYDTFTIRAKEKTSSLVGHGVCMPSPFSFNMKPETSSLMTEGP